MYEIPDRGAGRDIEHRGTNQVADGGVHETHLCAVHALIHATAERLFPATGEGRKVNKT